MTIARMPRQPSCKAHSSLPAGSLPNHSSFIFITLHCLFARAKKKAARSRLRAGGLFFVANGLSYGIGKLVMRPNPSALLISVETSPNGTP
jgi:hypothetical protein